MPIGDLPGPEGAVFLGLDDGAPRFAVDPDELPSAPRVEVVGLRELAAVLSTDDAGLLAYASAMVAWRISHRFCGVCGTRTGAREGGHLHLCPQCGAHHHPRTDPVVIMLVLDEGRALLGRQARWPAGRYSALAGFVEPGESLEDAVAREVLEEAGVEVGDVRYASSQPWPFPGSLMVGFTAVARGGAVEARDRELEDVRWFSRDEVRDGREGGSLNVPPPQAIARRLIDAWLAE